MGPCPIACQSEWSEWSTSGAVCGIGHSTRTLHVISEPLHGGDACESQTMETKNETLDACPSVCHGEWSEFSECSHTCGGGIKSRIYSILENGTSLPCPFENGTVETESCATEACDIDCAGSWSTGECSTSCGTGMRTNTWIISQPVKGEGLPCPFDEGVTDFQACDLGSCPLWGCVDPEASNFNPSAQIDDGSCDTAEAYQQLLGFWTCVGPEANVDFGGHMGSPTLVDEVKSHQGYYLANDATMILPSMDVETLSLTFEASEGMVASIFGYLFMYESGLLTFHEHSALVSEGTVVVQINGSALQLGNELFEIEPIDLSGSISFSQGYVSCVQVSEWQSTDSIEHNRQRCEEIVCSAIGDPMLCAKSGCELHNNECVEFCAPLCYASFLEDGQCQKECNNDACGYDSGSCCGGDHQECCSVESSFALCDSSDHICNINNQCVPQTESPTASPSQRPSSTPSQSPSSSVPSASPSSTAPSNVPTSSPTSSAPSTSPSFAPSTAPTLSSPSKNPSSSPSAQPSRSPSTDPTNAPSVNPTTNPSKSPSVSPTVMPSMQPSFAPTSQSCADAFSMGLQCMGVDEPIDAVCQDAVCDFTGEDYYTCCTPRRVVSLRVMGEIHSSVKFTLMPENASLVADSLPYFAKFSPTSALGYGALVTGEVDPFTRCEIRDAPCWSVWNSDAQGQTCGDRISSVIELIGEESAFELVASDYIECSLCDPSLNDMFFATIENDVLFDVNCWTIKPSSAPTPEPTHHCFEFMHKNECVEGGCVWSGKNCIERCESFRRQAPLSTATSYNKLRVNNAHECEDKCIANIECGMYSFEHEGSFCFLFKESTALVPSTKTTTGFCHSWNTPTISPISMVTASPSWRETCFDYASKSTCVKNGCVWDLDHCFESCTREHKHVLTEIPFEITEATLPECELGCINDFHCIAFEFSAETRSCSFFNETFNDALFEDAEQIIIGHCGQTRVPSSSPSVIPTMSPTKYPTTSTPSASPSLMPSSSPSISPTVQVRRLSSWAILGICFATLPLLLVIYFVVNRTTSNAISFPTNEKKVEMEIITTTGSIASVSSMSKKRSPTYSTDMADGGYENMQDDELHHNITE